LWHWVFTSLAKWKNVLWRGQLPARNKPRRTGWKLGDVRGILEINSNISKQITASL